MKFNRKTTSELRDKLTYWTVDYYYGTLKLANKPTGELWSLFKDIQTSLTYELETALLDQFGREVPLTDEQVLSFVPTWIPEHIRKQRAQCSKPN